MTSPDCIDDGQVESATAPLYTSRLPSNSKICQRRFKCSQMGLRSPPICAASSSKLRSAREVHCVPRTDLWSRKPLGPIDRLTIGSAQARIRALFDRFPKRPKSGGLDGGPSRILLGTRPAHVRNPEVIPQWLSRWGKSPTAKQANGALAPKPFLRIGALKAAIARSAACRASPRRVRP